MVTIALLREQFHSFGLQKGKRIDVSGQRFPLEPPDQRLFGGGAGQLPLIATTMFQTFSRLLYHWHDVWSARGRFGASVRPDDCVPQLLPPGERAFGQFPRGLLLLILATFCCIYGRCPGASRGTGDLRHYLDHLYQSGLSNRSVARHLTTLAELLRISPAGRPESRPIRPSTCALPGSGRLFLSS